MKAFFAGVLVALAGSVVPVQADENGEVNTKTLNVRESPSLQALIPAQIEQGQEVEILDIDGEWAEIKVENMNGFVHHEFLDFDLSDVEGYRYKLIDATSLNVRDSPSTDSNIIDGYPGGTIVEGKPHNSSWAVNRKGEYFSRNFADDFALASQKSEVTTQSSATVYPEPDTSETELGEINAGSTVTTFDVSEDWTEVLFENRLGYINSDKLPSEVVPHTTSKQYAKVTEDVRGSYGDENALTNDFQDRLSVKDSPSIDARTTWLLEPSTIVKVNHQQGDFYRITHQERHGYAHEKFMTLTDEEPDLEPGTPETTIMYTTAGSLRVREAPTTEGNQVGSLPFGSEIEVIDTVDGWAKIHFGGTEAYVSMYYVESSEPTTEDQPEEPEEPAEPKRFFEITPEWLNVREEGTHESNQVTALPAGTEVEKIGKDDDWYEIDYGDGTGYVNSRYLKELTDQLLTGTTIVLDAGHGGHDGGASFFGVRESIKALKITLKANELLREEGAQVILTRNNDEYITLSGRTVIANSSDADYFISVHHNAALSSQANGIETYFYDGNNDLSQESNQLAHAFQNSLTDKVSWSDRGVKHGNFQVLRNNDLPAILLEIGFISNPQEAEALTKTSKQQKFAEAIVDGAIAYEKHN